MLGLMQTQGLMISGLLTHAARHHASAAIISRGHDSTTHRYTWADAERRARRLVRVLEKLGIGEGDRVGTLAWNGYRHLEVYYAAPGMGAVCHTINPRLHPDDIVYIVNHAADKVLFADLSFVPLLAGIAPAIKDNVRHVVMLCGPEEMPELTLPPGMMLHCHDTLLDAADEDHVWRSFDENTASALCYTSGTTGRPKGVPRTHTADRAGGLGQALHHGYEHGDRTLGVMPLYHTMGIHSLVAMHLVGGCYVPQARWDPGEALRLIEEERITSLYLAPTLFYDLVSEERLAEHDVSSVRALGYAGSAMTSTVVTRCAEVFEPEVFVNHYGSTEVYTFSIGNDQIGKPGCAGRPSVNVRLKLEPSGEICAHLSGDEAFGGYWNRPDADAKAIRGGWYHTGDTGHLDADGDLWIDGRLDDMIISGGENIHPLEVEDVLASHPGVREAAVVGSPDDRLGQRVVAVVVGDATAEELDAHCLASPLARFKRPREYRLVPALPKSASGKILRRVLRDEPKESV